MRIVETSGTREIRFRRVEVRRINRRVKHRPQHHCSAGRCVCQGIRDQVAHCPLQEGAVQFGNDRLIGDRGGKRDSAVCSRGFVIFSHSAQQFGHIHPLAAQVGQWALRACQKQEVADEVR